MRKKSSGNRILKTVILALVLAVLVGVAGFFIFGRNGGFAGSHSIQPETDNSQPAAATGILTPEPSKEPEPEVTVTVSELMPSNKSSLADEDSRFPDWLELYNPGSQEADLSRCSLRIDGDSIDLDGITIAPGGYHVLFCPGKLSAAGGTVIFKNNKGLELCNITYDATDRDTSIRVSEEGLTTSVFPTPGQPNSDDGYDRWQSSLKTEGPLVINEVMVYNNSYLRTNNQYYDWVEIKNVSNGNVLLSDYYLSDANSDRMLFQLPPKTVSPGGLYIIYCSGEQGINNQDFAPFSLNAHKDELYLSNSDGALCDYISLHDIPLGGSAGRMDGENGMFYFTTPTPQSENLGGYRCIAARPIALEPDGVFNDVSSVTVTLSAPGTIYYTLNGDIPTTESAVYTGPLTLSNTTVIRAINYESGKLTADPLSLSYIINENHTAPVVSLIASQADFNYVYNNYTADIERTGAVEYFGEDGSFSLDCGFKLHGETSRSAKKKSFKITFRSRYDGELKYDLFNNGITEFSSILLRSAQEDFYSSQMRDNLIHQMSIAAFPELPAQDYRYAVLYVNGQYWGLYNIREAHSPEHYANHYGYNADSVEMFRENYPNSCQYMTDICTYVSYHSMSNAADYEYISSILNTDSVIGWTILQAYCGNIDCYPNNVRLYYSSEDNVLRYALLDLDLGFFGRDGFSIPLSNEYRYTNLARALLSSPAYRNEFLSQMSAALTGPMSNDSVVSLIDKFEEEMHPEVYRDKTRWGGTLDQWEGMIDNLRTYVTQGNGRARIIAANIRSYVAMTDAEYQQYFGSVK